jgi:superfamily II DNA or RNA helicase
VDTLDEQLSYFVEGYRYSRAFKIGVYNPDTGQQVYWDGKRHLLNQSMVFPTGLLKRVCDFLSDNHVSFSIDDKRVDPEHGPELDILSYEPRSYQEEATSVALKEGRGIIRIGTGGGKSLVSAMITARYNIPTMIYVVGKDLLYQFYNEFKKVLGEERVGIIGDGVCDIRKFNICSVWTAVKSFGIKTKVSLDDEDWNPEVSPIEGRLKRQIKSAVEDTRLAIFDEAHFLACDSIQAIFKAGKGCRYMFGMSGTDWRDDGADLLLESICGQRIYNMPTSKLIEMGYLVPAHISLVSIPRIEEDLPKNWKIVYSKYVTDNEVRSQIIADSARVLVGMKRKVLILIRYIQHGKKLVDMLSDLPICFINGKVDGQTRASIKKRFEDGKIDCLIASSVFDIGIDIPSLDALIMAGGGKSTVRTLQRIGRVIRSFPGKKDAIVMDTIDHARYLDKHSSTRIYLYKTEPGFKIKFPEGFDKRSLKKVTLKEKIKK